MNEIQARLCHDVYGLETVGLRYFNVFGPRQNPSGGYAAVIPHWIVALLAGQDCVIHGDGAITRDFCHVADVVQANLLAATTRERSALGEVFNVGLGAQTTLDGLYATLAARVSELTGAPAKAVTYGPPRPGDIRHSGADIGKITRTLDFQPEVSIEAALQDTVRAFSARL
jgi:UDP-N-acetylglucosamine 4-epimerase